jgi:hypothetical protein
VIKREYVIPLQALLALTLCFGMAWLIYAMAFFNPSPPTSLDIQLRRTEDGSVANLSTIAALLTMLPMSGDVATPVILSRATPTFAIPSAGGSGIILVFTPFPSPRASPSLPAFGTLFQSTETPVPFDPTFTPVFTPTRTFTPTFTQTLVPTQTPSSTPTPTPTLSPSPVPTQTDTTIPPTNTPVSPTDTPLPPSETPEPEPPTPPD